MNNDTKADPDAYNDTKRGLSWIGADWERRQKRKRAKRKKFEQTVLQCVLLKILTSVNQINENFSKFFAVGNHRREIEVDDEMWKVMLKRRRPDDYVLRLFIKQAEFTKSRPFQVSTLMYKIM